MLSPSPVCKVRESKPWLLGISKVESCLEDVSGSARKLSLPEKPPFSGLKYFSDSESVFFIA